MDERGSHQATEASETGEGGGPITEQAEVEADDSTAADIEEMGTFICF